MRLCILISTIALLNWGSSASALTHRRVAPIIMPIANFTDANTPGAPRTGVAVQNVRRRNLRQIRNDSTEGQSGPISKIPSVPGSPSRRRSAALEGVPPELSMPPAHPACPCHSSTTATSSTSTTSSAKSASTQLIDNVEGTESKLLLGTKSSSSPEPSTSTTTSPSSSETPSKNEANDNLSKYIEEVRVENDRFLDLGAKKVKGDPKQGR